jgi:Mg/Co/Ni transporter MgtE
MGDPVFVGPLREAVDILRIHQEKVLAVVDRAQLVGIIRRDALEVADPGILVSQIMEEPRSVGLTDLMEDCVELGPVFAPDPIPVVDGDGLLVGGVFPD